MVKEIIEDAKNRMTKSLQSLEGNFSKIRAGRAHPSLLDQISVEYYGAQVPLSQVSNINAEDSRTLKVAPWEKDMVGPIEKAILTSDLGLNPQIDGQLIRLPVPELNEERRTELKKLIKSIGEKCKVSIRNIRRDANDELKKLLKDKEIGEDEEKSSEKSVQTITDNHIKSVDEKVSLKEKEIMTI